MKKISELYDHDYHAWIHANIDSIKQGKLNNCDFEHIVEELESMTKKDLRELRSRLINLIFHILKWKYQPTYRGSSWINTITENRQEIEDLLYYSPSLKNSLKELINDNVVKRRVISKFVKETGLSANILQDQIEFTLEQILDENFLPN